MAQELTSSDLILDSWPVLEWLKGREPCSSRFDGLVDEAEAGRVQFHMSRINRGEVVYSIAKANDIRDREATLFTFLSLPVSLHGATDDVIDDAVSLKSRYSFAFADAFAAVLAMRLNAPIVTGDREFLSLQADGLIALHWVGL